MGNSNASAWGCCAGKPLEMTSELHTFAFPVIEHEGLEGCREEAPGLDAKTALPTLLEAPQPPQEGLKASFHLDDAEGSTDSTCENDDHMCERQYTHQEEQLLHAAKRRWTLTQHEVEKVRRASELEALLETTRAAITEVPARMVISANRYGSDAKLPRFEFGRHVPILALINPFSGGMAGSDILAIARGCPSYSRRFFNIIDVVKDQRRGGLLDVFRIELCKVKDEARAMATRPRLISAGGDGTASFSLFILFAALRADSARADEGLKDTGNGFIWTDAEMAESFPALAQMPLGSANDFGRTLGWGQKYPGDAEARGAFGSRSKAQADLERWIAAVISQDTRTANFDLFGIMPENGKEACDFKVCELTGPRGRNPKVSVNGKQQLIMKEPGTPVPLFVCLYFSAGFAAYMTARFQMNRRRGPLRNKLEYARQAAAITMESIPPQLNVGLEGVQLSCGGEPYFPPRSSDGTGGYKYREVGFLNINWQGGMANGRERAPACGRLCSSREPAKFNDGQMDMYRLKFASAIKNPGLTIQTDKKDGGLTLTYSGGHGKGIFFQWDGEARFAFSPSGDAFHMHIRKILNIPVVLGPGYDARVTGDADNGQEVRFGFAGETPEQRVAHQKRVMRGVLGELNAELLATSSDMTAAGLPCQ
mmetsp:Transcript_148827/g.386989  ORF Transcript_148827/g.386989 Transcript_148827/m.386989 type:complete len:653 (-) Transcript_148827:212-2170(-)